MHTITAAAGRKRTRNRTGSRDGILLASRPRRGDGNGGIRQAVALFAAVTCLLAGAGALPTLADRGVVPGPTVGVRVGPADSLWSIAEENRLPGLTTAQVVARIRTLNHLSGAGSIQPGDTLAVPSRDDASAALAMR